MCRLCAAGSEFNYELSNKEKEDAINAFVNCIRFETISSIAATNGAYNSCAEWILKQLAKCQVDVKILPESKPNKPIVVATFLGSEPDLPGVLFNCHVDVVPALIENWTVPAFEGVRKDGRIYGRGTQDMKCVCVQYIVAIKKLRRSGYFPKRTLLFTWVPDEEIGGVDGMNVLIQSQWFRDINIGFAFDEGLACEEENAYSVFYGERLPWWVHITAKGDTGHASRFVETTAVEQIMGVANKALAFRQEQKDLLHGGAVPGACSHAIAAKKKTTLGDVTSLNLTMLRSGVRAGDQDVYNVVPPVAECGLDIRISPHMSPDTMAATLTAWCEECRLPGGSVEWKLLTPLRVHSVTSLDTRVNPWWGIFQRAIEVDCGVSLVPSVFPAATDSRFLRAMGIRAIGFSPMRKSPILLHEHDEYIDEEIFLEGCHVYIHLMKVFSSQPIFEGDNQFLVPAPPLTTTS